MPGIECFYQLFLLSTLPVRHWRAHTEGKACMRCLPKAKEPKKQMACCFTVD